ncbi:MAG: hypothetical protein QM654_14535 [Dysgonamonadaceae bacterium]
MKPKHYTIFLIGLISSILFSCKNEKREYDLGETEYYFDEKLSSISSDGHGAFWLGTETGDLIHFKDNQRQLFELGEDRIYKVVQEVNASGDSVFWIGIRNSGLQEWKQEGKNKLTKIKTFNIPFKADKYSAYDFHCTKGRFFLATSQGIYTFDRKNKNDSLHLIYPSEKYLSRRNGTTFVVQHICIYKDSLLIAATQEGLFLMNLANNQSRFVLKNNFIDYVYINNKKLFALSKGTLFECNINGDILNSQKLDNSPKLYYQSQGISFLLGTDELLLSQNLKDYTAFKLRRFIPLQNSKNIILPDSIRHFTYMVTENAVWRIANHIDAFNNNINIKATCSTDDKNYYLTSQNKLYVQDQGSDKAKWLYSFSENNPIVWMDVLDNELYFYNTNNEFLKMQISDNWIKNKLLHSPKIIYKSDARITAACIKKMGEKTVCYLGIQDGLVSIDENKHIDTFSALSREYITSMFGHEYTDRIYISTLNNGVFYLSRDKQIKQIPETRKVSFIKGIVTSNDHVSNLITLTNQYIKSENPKDSIHVKGYKKLLYVNDSLFYALPENGLHKFIISKGKIVDKGIFFNDINFTPNSCYSDGEKLLLGSAIGAFILYPNRENKPVWLEFNEAINITLLNTVIAVILLILFSGTISLYFLREKKTNIIQTKRRKEDLVKRIKTIVPFIDFFDESDQTEIRILEEQVNSIQIQINNKEEINTLLDKLSPSIANLNRTTALILPKKLEEQKRLISLQEAFDKEDLILKIGYVQNKNDFELIKEQIIINKAWIENLSQMQLKLNEEIQRLTNCAEIEGVNKNIYFQLLDIRENIKFRSLTEIQQEYETIENKLKLIHSEESTQLINKYINEIRCYLNGKSKEEEGLEFLSEMLEKTLTDTPHASADNYTLLKALKRIDRKVKALQILDELHEYIAQYSERHKQLIKINDKQINKKFDKELASFVNKETENISRKINTLITAFYDRITKIDDARFFIDLLKINNFQGQHTRVLAILIADPKVKRVLIPGMLGIYGNLNPVISRLISERIKPNETILKEYQESTAEKSIFAYYLLKLLE